MTGGQYPVLSATKISLKRGHPFDCSCQEQEEVTKRKLVEDKVVPSAATSEKGSFNFSVFISFRGKDTRNGFTSHLHKDLEGRGITTFIDSEWLEKGRRINDLLNYLEGSKIFVPVFSKAYAQSKWCLKEITKIVEINKRKGENRPIIPIFYDVNPSDVRCCQASFGKAFEKHQRNKKLGDEQINEWKAALGEAGSIFGYCLSETGGNEAKLITLIAARISNLLSKVPFDIQPIGINSHINILTQMLEREKDSNCMIGICGLGGIGKTTIAMAFYNELYPTFEACCFLSDIRENENREGLPSLQAKLMNEVLRDNMRIKNVRQGVSLIKQRLSRKKILLILDDVDHTRQLEAFTANPTRNEEWLGVGSKIIVTTRNKEVLLRHGLQADEIYCPQILDAQESLQLFFHHASVSQQLLAKLGSLPQEVVEVAAGLPLALVVFGAHFSFLREKNEWETTLERLKREQNKEIHERLRISYESLNHQEKLVFLDIACFFIGEPKEYPMYMWKACHCFPENTLKVLRHKSLIKINQHDKFEMHDQIRDMGRMIVKEEGNFDPLKYSRPWRSDQVLKVLEDAEVSQGNPYLQRIHLPRLFYYDLVMAEEIPKLRWESIAVMPDLRMIDVGSGIPFDEDKKDIHLPRKLQWLSWYGCPNPTVTFHSNRHGHLCILDLSYGEFGDFGTRSMVFPQLKVLDLSWCSNLKRAPDFTLLPSLEVLRLDYCSSLAEMDESIGHLKKLIKLSMKRCWNLRGLPVGHFKLTSLEFLDIADCEQISDLPEDIGSMKSLKYLNLQGTSVTFLPDSIGRLQSLESLDLADCSSLEKIPDSIGGLEISISLSKYWSLQPEDIYNKLQIYLEGCILWEKLLNSIYKLRVIQLDGCKSLRSIPDSLVDMENICILSLCDCESLEELPESIGKLELLFNLDLSGCTSLRKIPESIGSLKSLMRLRLRNCESLEELPESIGWLLSLQVLELSGCTSLRKIPKSIGNLNIKLKWFSLEQCSSLEEPPELLLEKL